MTEFYNFFISNMTEPYGLPVISTGCGFVLFVYIWDANSSIHEWLKEKYLLMVLMTINWAFPLVILSKAKESILDKLPTNDSLFIFLFQLTMYMVVLGLLPLLISYLFRKKYTIEKTYVFLISIWYLIIVIPDLHLLYGWFGWVFS